MLSLKAGINRVAGAGRVAGARGCPIPRIVCAEAVSRYDVPDAVPTKSKGSAASVTRPADLVYQDAVPGETPSSDPDASGSYLNATVSFLQEELPRMFQTGRLTRSRYASAVTFTDPLLRADSLTAFGATLTALVTLFEPSFELLAVSPTGAATITARWSLMLRARFLPWRPSAGFTGMSTFTMEPGTGLITSITNTWDGVHNTSFLSLEALRHAVASFAEVRLTPDLETPNFKLLLAAHGYEVRDYAPFTVAEAPMPTGAGPASGAGFTTLASYIFGGNDAGLRMEMTTPVLSTVGGEGGGAPGSNGPPKMAFVMERRFAVDGLPRARSSGVAVRDEPSAVRAVATFSGFPLDHEVVAAERGLRAALAKDGLEAEAGYVLARYNEPTVPPFLRRNEVLITLRDYSVPALTKPRAVGASGSTPAGLTGDSGGK